MYPTRPPGPPPYTLEEIANLSTPNERFKAEASLRSYIVGHRLADERERYASLDNSNAGYADDELGRADAPIDLTGDEGEPFETKYAPGSIRRVSGRNTSRGRGRHQPYPTSRLARVQSSNLLCSRFTSTGRCARPGCPDMHNPEKLALCKHMLYKSYCDNGNYCDLSHLPDPNNTPHCLYYLKGRCTKTPCAFAHVDVDPAAPVCNAFGHVGYCDNGASCMRLHLHECPDFANTGTCTAGDGCTKRHIYRASRMKPASHDSSSAINSPNSAEGSSVGDDTLGFREQEDFVSLIET